MLQCTPFRINGLGALQHCNTVIPYIRARLNKIGGLAKTSVASVAQCCRTVFWSYYGGGRGTQTRLRLPPIPNQRPEVMTLRPEVMTLRADSRSHPPPRAEERVLECESGFTTPDSRVLESESSRARESSRGRTSENTGIAIRAPQYRHRNTYIVIPAFLCVLLHARSVPYCIENHTYKYLLKRWVIM